MDTSSQELSQTSPAKKMQKHGSAQTSKHVSAASSPSKLNSSHGSSAASPAKKDKQSAIMPAILEFDSIETDRRFPRNESRTGERALCSAHAPRIPNRPYQRRQQPRPVHCLQSYHMHTLVFRFFVVMLRAPDFIFSTGFTFSSLS